MARRFRDAKRVIRYINAIEIELFMLIAEGVDIIESLTHHRLCSI